MMTEVVKSWLAFISKILAKMIHGHLTGSCPLVLIGGLHAVAPPDFHTGGLNILTFNLSLV